MQLRKKFREKIEDVEEYNQEEWKKILKSYAELEAYTKYENDKRKEEDEKEEAEEEKDDEKNDDTIKEDFWKAINKFKQVLNE